MLETLLQIIKFLQELGLTPINLLLVSMLYFMGAKSDFFPKFWIEKPKTDDDVKLVDIMLKMRRLETYFNHETTEKLNDIGRTTNKISLNQDKIHNDVQQLNTQHKIWNEAGIKVKTK